MARRSDSEALRQALISSRLRQQPSHSPVRSFSRHTSMQGERVDVLLFAVMSLFSVRI